MEFKRFYDFYNNENAMRFHTYLPIQLDATCNGFKHMALLSNEEVLFEELNLVSKSGKDKPGDFYRLNVFTTKSLFIYIINLFSN